MSCMPTHLRVERELIRRAFVANNAPARATVVAGVTCGKILAPHAGKSEIKAQVTRHRRLIRVNAVWHSWQAVTSSSGTQLDATVANLGHTRRVVLAHCARAPSTSKPSAPVPG